MRIRLWIVAVIALVAAGCSVPPNPGEMLCGTISFDELIWNRPGHEMTAMKAFDLDAGPYSVRLFSRDDAHRAGYLPTQTEERWKLEGLDDTGAVVVATSATEDLAEDKTARQDDVGSYDFTGVTHVRGYHALGDQGVLSSITADYAEFWSNNCGEEPYEPVYAACERSNQSLIPPRECDYLINLRAANTVDYEPPQPGTFTCSGDGFDVECGSGRVTGIESSIGGPDPSFPTFPTGISALTALAEITLAEGATLPDDFGGLGNLRVLTNYEYPLRYSGSGAGLAALRHIVLEWDSVKDGEFDWIGQVPNLASLNLAGNELTDVPANFFALRTLEELDLGPVNITYQNWFTEFPDEIRGMTSLRTLDMSQNPVTGLPAWIGELSNLSDLDLSSTGVPDGPDLDGKTIPDSIQSTSLTSLNLGDQCMVASPATAAWLDANAPNWNDGCP